MQSPADPPSPWWAGEHAIRVSSIPQHVPPHPDGRRIGVAVAFRWTLAGRGGIRLRRYKLGGYWHTTLEEIDRWSAALTAAAEASA